MNMAINALVLAVNQYPNRTSARQDSKRDRFQQLNETDPTICGVGFCIKLFPTDGTDVTEDWSADLSKD